MRFSRTKPIGAGVLVMQRSRYMAVRAAGLPRRNRDNGHVYACILVKIRKINLEKIAGV